MLALCNVVGAFCRNQTPPKPWLVLWGLWRWLLITVKRGWTPALVLWWLCTRSWHRSCPGSPGDTSATGCWGHCGLVQVQGQSRPRPSAAPSVECCPLWGELCVLSASLLQMVCFPRVYSVNTLLWEGQTANTSTGTGAAVTACFIARVGRVNPARPCKCFPPPLMRVLANKTKVWWQQQLHPVVNM